MRTLPFDVEAVFQRVAAAVEPYPQAALFELRQLGFGSLWEQLVACIISIRTRDETTLPVAQALFARARTAAATLALPRAELEVLIRPSTFSERKAGQIRLIAEQVVREHNGDLPCDREVLLGFGGVGPKCANLALGIACGEPLVSVDVHVHRVTYRWGYVTATTPQAATGELEAKLPRHLRIDINRLLVPFGKHVCTGRAPRCSVCPVLPWCAQVGVTTHR